MIARKGKMNNTNDTKDGTLEYIHDLTKEKIELQEKLHRRNMQIRELKKRLENRIVPLSTMHCIYESAMRYKKYESDRKCPYEIILK